MTVTSIDIDPDLLSTARTLIGAASNRDTVDRALKTLIAMQRQPTVIEEIIAHKFSTDQIDAPTIEPGGQYSSVA
ncbi:hypothetical protein B7R22_13155 [Subtercola boreus]|uniref:DUF2191 domain-containing protein n=1 Tax=Subtercola boreus TaxID=120213 RepID=A0A3E0VXN9_9MICO|nr:type II toxin-antitoxin system VapB family antitoxin [Subtercola boreus]RFA13597.1 hypothetical protein B7R22_13155 [Subtercola boreus]